MVSMNYARVFSTLSPNLDVEIKSTSGRLISSSEIDVDIGSKSGQSFFLDPGLTRNPIEF